MFDFVRIIQLCTNFLLILFMYNDLHCLKYNVIHPGTANLNEYYSTTECTIDLKPSCIFKFVHCLEVYEKKLINLDRGGTLEGLLSARVPQNQPRRVNFRVHLEVHEGP